MSIILPPGVIAPPEPPAMLTAITQFHAAHAADGHVRTYSPLPFLLDQPFYESARDTIWRDLDTGGLAVVLITMDAQTDERLVVCRPDALFNDEQIRDRFPLPEDVLLVVRPKLKGTDEIVAQILFLMPGVKTPNVLVQSAEHAIAATSIKENPPRIDRELAFLMAARPAVLVCTFPGNPTSAGVEQLAAALMAARFTKMYNWTPQFAALADEAEDIIHVVGGKVLDSKELAVHKAAQTAASAANDGDTDTREAGDAELAVSETPDTEPSNTAVADEADEIVAAAETLESPPEPADA